VRALAVLSAAQRGPRAPKKSTRRPLARKPLTTASGPAMNGVLEEILLKGKRIDAKEALRKGALVNGVPWLVPTSWRLVCRKRSGEEHIVATHVSSFDIAPDGAILFSNGNGVFAVKPDQAPQVLLRDQLIEDVVARPAPAATPPTPAGIRAGADRSQASQFPLIHDADRDSDRLHELVDQSAVRVCGEKGRFRGTRAIRTEP